MFFFFYFLVNKRGEKEKKDMYSLSQRFQTVVNFSVTVSFFVIFFIIGSSHYDYFQKDVGHTVTAEISNIQPALSWRTSRYYGSVNGKPKENLKIKFNLDADLTPLFNWNTKQVFVFLTAEYNNTRTNTVNEVTFWDTIVKSPEEAVLSLENVKSKYSVWDVSDRFSERDLKFKLHWSVQPWVGVLMTRQFGTVDDKELVVRMPENVAIEGAKEKKAKKSHKKQKVA